MSDFLQRIIAMVCGLVVFGFSYIKLFLDGKSRKQRLLEKAMQS